MEKKTRLFCIINCTLSLVLGLMIYLLFREGTYIHSLFGMDKRLVSRNECTDLIGFYFSDAAWAYSLFFSLELVWNNRAVVFICALFLSVIWEIAQLFKIVGGTFDYFDIITYFAALISAVIIIKIWRNHYETNND